MSEEIEEKDQKRNNRAQHVRSEEIRSSEKKTRRSKLDDVDEFFIDPREVPDGFTVEWKRYQTYGKADTPHLNDLSKDGWEPATPKDFPTLIGKYHTGEFILGGRHQDLILMIRPKELTREAVHEDKIKAKQQVQTKMEELGLSKPGEAPRYDSAGRPLTKVNRSYERIPVTD